MSSELKLSEVIYGMLMDGQNSMVLSLEFDSGIECDVELNLLRSGDILSGREKFEPASFKYCASDMSRVN